MKITYLGHSSFLIEDEAGTAIVCDPYDKSIGYSMPRVKADAVTISHHHYDHDCVGEVAGSPKILEGEVNADVNGIKITTAQSYHDECGGAKRGKNTIFKFSADGVTVCHLGDLGEPYSEQTLKKIIPCDVLLIPVGGNYTIDARRAKEYITHAKPRAVIPMHFARKGGKIDIAGVENFLSLFPAEDVIRAGCTVTINGEILNGEKTKIIYMEKFE